MKLHWLDLFVFVRKEVLSQSAVSCALVQFCQSAYFHGWYTCPRHPYNTLIRINVFLWSEDIETWTETLDLHILLSKMLLAWNISNPPKTELWDTSLLEGHCCCVLSSFEDISQACLGHKKVNLSTLNTGKLLLYMHDISLVRSCIYSMINLRPSSHICQGSQGSYQSSQKSYQGSPRSSWLLMIWFYRDDVYPKRYVIQLVQT